MMRLPVTPKQLKFLQQIGVEDKEYTPAELENDVIDKLIVYLTAYGFTDSNQEQTNNIGDMCEAIIDRIYEIL